MLDDPHVSRKHAGITRLGDQLFVWGEGSKSGTAVNGAQIICAKLEHGDTIHIGAQDNPLAAIATIEVETVTDFLKATT